MLFRLRGEGTDATEGKNLTWKPLERGKWCISLRKWHYLEFVWKLRIAKIFFRDCNFLETQVRDEFRVTLHCYITLYENRYQLVNPSTHPNMSPYMKTIFGENYCILLYKGWDKIPTFSEKRKSSQINKLFLMYILKLGPFKEMSFFEKKNCS